MSMTIFQLLNGATFAALLFVVASGFTLIFGLMRIVNLAHGALYLFGGYLGLTVANLTGNFFLGAIGAAVGSLLVGMLSTFGQVWFPELAYFVIFGPMAILLAFRPLGLFGKVA